MSEEIVKTEKKRKTSSKNSEEVSSRAKTTTARRRKTASDPAEQTPKKPARRKSAKAENGEKTAEPKKKVSRKKKTVKEPETEQVTEPVQAVEVPKYTVEYRSLEIADTYAQAAMDQKAVLPERHPAEIVPAPGTAVIAAAAETVTAKAAEELKPEETEPVQEEKPAEETAQAAETEDTAVIFPEEKTAEEAPAETEEAKAEPADTDEKTPEQPEMTEPVQQEKPAEEVTQAAETEDTAMIFPEEKTAEEAPAETEEAKAEPADTDEKTPEQPEETEPVQEEKPAEETAQAAETEDTAVIFPKAKTEEVGEEPAEEIPAETLEATEPVQEEKPAEEVIKVTEEVSEEDTVKADTEASVPETERSEEDPSVGAEEVKAADSEQSAAENETAPEAAEEPVRTDKPAEVFPDIPRKKSLFKRKQAHTIELSVNDLNKAIAEKNTPKADSSLILMTDLNLPILKVLFMPVWTAERYRRENKTPGISALYIMALKWAMAFLGIVWFLYWHLNEEAFSYARMTFTDASWVWFRYTFIGFVSEYLCIQLITAIYKPNDPHISYRRVRMMATAPDFLIGVLYLAAGLALNISFAGGCVLFIAAAAVSPVLHDLCFVYTKGYPTWKRLLTVYVSGLITALLFILFTKFFAVDLIKIFEAVVNL